MCVTAKPFFDPELHTELARIRNISKAMRACSESETRIAAAEAPNFFLLQRGLLEIL